MDDELKLIEHKGMESRRTMLSQTEFYMYIFCCGAFHTFADAIFINSANFIIKHGKRSGTGHFIIDLLMMIETFGMVFLTGFVENMIAWENPLSNLIYMDVARAFLILGLLFLTIFENISPELFLWVMLIITSAITLIQVVIFVGMLKYISVYGERSIHGLSLGSSLAGVLSELCRILTILFTDPECKLGLLIYFSLTGFVTLIAAFLLCKLEENEILTNRERNAVDEYNPLILDPSNGVMVRLNPALSSSKPIVPTTINLDESTDSFAYNFVSSFKNILHKLSSEGYGVNITEPYLNVYNRYYRIYRKGASWYWFSLLSYVHSLVLPSYIFLFKPNTKGLGPKLLEIFPLTIMMSYSIGKYIGRSILSWPSMATRSVSFMAYLTTLAFLHYPFVLVCNIHIPHTAYPIPRLITSDLAVVFLILTFGITTGYISTNSSMMVPMIYHSHHEKVMSGTIMAYTVSLGCTIGCLISFSSKIFFNSFYPEDSN